ncbi:hypothetical protein A1Q2_00667 [Trichosporon asahii var. asahii CBS 8904]|uniref:ATP synthase mitochondrial F1 complex assembly factor 1 n=1 Tax=Trichosporon asahii var. asahii (strain CBS 8904) TaxID=1220162 RepID=K1W847_TRIAC|nr:hypothetical protein A1Q2_00667 [Trichosporon asahii var. asahii CBS 8904]
MLVLANFSEGLSSLDQLKQKVQAPSVQAKLKAKKYAEEEAKRAEELRKASAAEAEQNAADEAANREERIQERQRQAQAAGDRSGVKPLASIINMPLLLMTPHTKEQIGSIWNAYHTTHKTLAPSYLSACLPLSTYESMIAVAKQHPQFVLPLPRQGEDGKEGWEMFFMQWLFHQTPSSPPTADKKGNEPLPPIASVIFTPLEEFKVAGEWAQPYLTLTFYPDFGKTHDLVLMRGEIAAHSTNGPPEAKNNPGFLLGQQEAQLLAMALQRFYCSELEPPSEVSIDKDNRLARRQTLKDFVERPEEWNWQNLIDQAYSA